VISGDEETSGDFTKWIVGEGKHLVDAEFAINTDAGGGEYKEQGNHRAFWIQTSEKLYQTYRLTARNKGGHSSVPRPDNAISDLSVAITRLAGHQFPVNLSETNRMAMRRSAALYPENVARDMLVMANNEFDASTVKRLSEYDPYFNAMLRTTCVPTQLSGGHAENALPREASVIVNCRIMPGTEAIEIENVITGLSDGLGVELEIVWDGVASDVSDIPEPMMEKIEALAEVNFGDVPVIPAMSTGATDGLFYRNTGTPVYGISGLFSKPGETGAHGLDEKIGVKEFHESVDFLNQVLRAMAE
jgi:acetylornithine deacetylase/succinyl-diaminopimelate desuccinylase-like protein